MKYRHTAAMVLLMPVLLACAAPTRQLTPSQTGAISIVDIIDGDTIRIADGSGGAPISARLVGFDTPETVDPGCPQELALGNTATQRLQVILHDARRIDPVVFGTDRFDRQLLKLVIDGRDLADIMVSEGLAVPYSGGRRINWCQKLAAS